jgi:hypothetical protein
MESGAIWQAEEFSIMVYSLGVLNFRHHDLLSTVVHLVPPALPKFTTSVAQDLRLWSFLKAINHPQYHQKWVTIVTIRNCCITVLLSPN